MMKTDEIPEVHPLCRVCEKRKSGRLLCGKIVDCVVEFYQKQQSGDDGIRIPESEIIRIAVLKRAENELAIRERRRLPWGKI